jgi:outer membrane receptor protein involved in Fe transport
MFASASLGYKNFLFLEGTFRHDYASTLPVSDNKYNYPSITGSFIFTDFVKQSWLSLGKVRLNWAKVGNLAPFNALTDEYVVGTPMNGAVYTLPNTKNNPKLKPETTYSYEAGLEMNFMKSRVGFDLSLYQQNSQDQIMPVSLSQTTGYQYMYVNAGEIRNRGIELTLNGTPIQTASFRWDINVNFAKNKNEVISLYPGIKNLQIGSFQGGVTVNAQVGQPYGALKGTDYTYTAAGDKIINATTGKPVKSTTSDKVLGNVNPDWTGGVHNTFSYKNLSLSFLIDIQQGGDIFSLDMYYGLSSGLYPETAGLNDLGNPVRDLRVGTPGAYASTSGGYIIKGVNVATDGTITPNQTRVSARTYSGFGYAALPNKAFVYDASYIKLREVSLTYNLPAVWLNKTFVKGVSLSAVGSNLWIIHKNLPYADPESGLAAGNAQGYSIGSLPTTRDFGFNIKINF